MRGNSRAWFVVLASLSAGCDPNPDGPTAPTAPASAPAPTEASPKAPAPKKKSINPLQKVGEPVGARACPALGRGEAVA